MSARPLWELLATVCSTANLHRSAVRTLLLGRRFSRAGAAFTLRLEEHFAALRAELWGGAYRHGWYALFRVLDLKAGVIALGS